MSFSIVAPKIVVADHRSRDIAWPVTSTVEVEVAGSVLSLNCTITIYVLYRCLHHIFLFTSYKV